MKPGDGRPLRRFRWWQLLSRSVLYLRLPGEQAVYAVDVRHWKSDDDGNTMAQLYLDGRQRASSRLPAVFPVPGGAIEVAASAFGLKRCHYVTADGAEYQLAPDPASAEGRRARLDRDHPALSRWLGVFSVLMLAIGVVLVVAQILEPILQVPPVAERFGRYESPINLPLWLNIALGVGAALASTERALRLRYSWLDSLGN
ncbi:hypothetical protein OHA21_17050 [Actinoplanes sp. NBC_00393]|uniref:hypothetical protein n=1 Tax=Actinoplanes sp. NBC_00393 TaxID=2975953 RepID=UPI002E1FE1BF